MWCNGTRHGITVMWTSSKRCLSFKEKYQLNKHKECDKLRHCCWFIYLWKYIRGNLRKGKTKEIQSSTLFQHNLPADSGRGLKERENKRFTQVVDPHLHYKVARLFKSSISAFKQQAAAAKNTINTMNYTFFLQILWVSYVFRERLHRMV